MARGKRIKGKTYKKCKEAEGKAERAKEEPMKTDNARRAEDKGLNRASSLFKSEEIQEICGVMNFDELSEHHCFLGAVVIGKFEVVKKLMKDGYDIDTVDENKETALVHAVKHFQLEMVDFLVTRGADISLADAQENTCLLVAAQSPLWDQDSFLGLWQSVAYNASFRVNHANKSGYTLLHYVTKRQWRTVLTLLLARQVSLECQTNKGVTPLVMAASRVDSAFVTALLEAGADVTVEDQQKCTALCYAIAYKLQKNILESNKSLELLLAAFKETTCKTTLNVYLERRLCLVVNPPKSKAEFAKTVRGVIVHVITYFARFVHRGMELLSELRVFYKLQEALITNKEEASYVSAVLAVVLELVRHCECCCQGMTQTDLADAFFSTGLGRILLNILTRHGTSKAGVLKAVFVPLIFVCTSESYLARTWLQKHHEVLLSFYNKYKKTFPIVLESTGDKHSDIEKERALTFQKIMKELKTKGRIVTKEEHTKASKKLKEEKALAISKNIYKVLPTKERGLSFASKKVSSATKVSNSKTEYTFGKLHLNKNEKEESQKSLKDSPRSPKDPKIPIEKKESIPLLSQPTQPKPDVKPIKERKFRIAIKEMQVDRISESEDFSSKPKQSNRSKISSNESERLFNDNSPSEQINLNDTNSIESENSSTAIQLKPSPQISSVVDHINIALPEVKEIIPDAYQQLQENNNSESSEDDSTRNVCEWLDGFASGDGNQAISESEVKDTLKILEESFNRIVSRYNSTWMKQYNEGYLGARGDCEDFLLLMKILPALEEFHIEQLMERWSKFCEQIKQHARKNHYVYAATVSEMQLFLVEFEAELERKNYKVFEEKGDARADVSADTEKIIRNLECNELMNVTTIRKPLKLFSCFTDNRFEGTHENCNDKPLINPEISAASHCKSIEPAESGSSIYNSETDDESVVGIWDVKLNEDMKPKPKLQHCGEYNTDNGYNPQMITTEVKSPVNTIEDVKLNSALNVSTNKTDSDGESDAFSENELNMMDVLEEKDCKVVATSFQNTHEDDFLKGPSTSNQVYKIEESFRKMKNCPNPPPGFENAITNNTILDNLSSGSSYCGSQYSALCLTLATLPACKTELLDSGKLRLASLQFPFDFKLFNGFNFGDVELGLNTDGVPLAIRRFQKVDTNCNKNMVETMNRLIPSLLHLSHDHILPYAAYHNMPHSVVFAIPLCHQDLGQYVRQIRTTLNGVITRDSLAPHLINLANQLMSGLHFLHTRDKPIIHGNLKPSNIMVDASGNLHLAEFGLHKVLFQQRSPASTSIIWWPHESILIYFNTLKYVCSLESDIQSAGMLVHFVLTLGHHPFGQNLPDIVENIKKAVVQIRCNDVIATDLLYWMLSDEPAIRPNTCEILRHMTFWSTAKRWSFLMTCCGLETDPKSSPLPLDAVHRDLDHLGQRLNVTTAWISTLKENCEFNFGSATFEDTTSGLLLFLNKYLRTRIETKDIFLELFPLLPLNLFRLLEQTEWILHPQFKPFLELQLPC